MNAVALGLVAAGAVVHAYWNILAKKGSSGPLFVWGYSAVAAILYLPLAIWALTTVAEWTLLGAAAVLISGALHVGYSLSLQAGYGRADLSVVYPVARGTGPALSVVGAILLIGEPFALATALGTALVVAGVLTIGLARRSAPTGAIWPGIQWGALTGLFIASYTLNDGAAVKLLSVPPIIVDYFGNLVRLAVLTPFALRSPRGLAGEWRKSRRAMLGVGALIPIPYILGLYAMTLAPVSLVAPARELSMMVGILFGRWLLNEPDIASRLGGAALIAAGVATLSLA